jgi:hypothetical protein
MWRSSWLVMRVQASPVTTNSMVREACEQCHAPTLVSARSAKSRLDHLIQLTDTSRHTIVPPSNRLLVSVCVIRNTMTNTIKVSRMISVLQPRDRPLLLLTLWSQKQRGREGGSERYEAGPALRLTHHRIIFIRRVQSQPLLVCLVCFLLFLTLFLCFFFLGSKNFLRTFFVLL